MRIVREGPFPSKNRINGRFISEIGTGEADTAPVGVHASRKLESAEWGDKVVNELARFLARTQPGLRGFTRRGLFGMRQFYGCYRDQPIVSAALTQLGCRAVEEIAASSRRPY